jgi:DNA-binding CsgD family transcriptional regulator
MNAKILFSDLHPAEKKVAELYAWGATKKEIANILHKSYYTIDNQIRNLFRKTGTRKDTEFSAWFFCTRFNITMSLSPFAKGIVAAFFLAIIGYGIVLDNNQVRCRVSRARISRIELVRTARRTKEA